MGNGVGKLSLCFAGDNSGDISRRCNDIAVCLSTDEGLGHSFCYIRPDPVEDSSKTALFRSISGAAISANTSTPLSTADPFAFHMSGSLDKAAAFESSDFFSSMPLQPIPRSSVSVSNPTVKSGPIIRNLVPGSGPIERGFMSGPIERSTVVSGPLESQLQRYTPNKYSKKWSLVKGLRKVVSKISFSGFSKELSVTEIEEHNNSASNSSTITSHNLSSEMSLIDENDDVVVEGNESSFGSSRNVQWAQGKAGEDRVHVVISEEHGWVFVGIYDGFNGPDATDFLMNNLYSNMYKELKGLLWCEKGEESVGVGSVDHLGVLRALSDALRKTEASYLEIADMMLMENPELALMGSCVLVMVMKGDDVYLLNVGDSRAVLAQKAESDSFKDDNEESIYGYEYENVHSLSSCQLTRDHCTSVKEVLYIRPLLVN